MNDQRRVIFSQRLKILKSENINQILEDFLNEVLNNLELTRNNYKKTNDKKSYLSALKNTLGNITNDDEFISFSILQKDSFIKKIKDIYLDKKKKRENLIGFQENSKLEKRIFLQIIDFTWRSHLQYLEQLRQVIGLRSYGQKDPLSEFKKEAFALFEGLLEKIKCDVVKFLLNLNIVISNEAQEKKEEELNLKDEKKIGRNEKCPCNSGKKYKHCCGSI